MRSKSWLRHLLSLAGYVAVALAFSWPLPLRLGNTLTGLPSGDTGVYVWNLWVFRHQVASHHASPFFTREILSLAPRLPLTLHNYTPAADAIAFPLIPIIGVTAAFNLIYLASVVVAAYGLFLLARQVTHGTGEAWLAGLLFGFSPALVARSTAHFSLVQAAPLPIFLLLLRRLDRRAGISDALLAGVTLAWTYLSDPYYAIYAVVLGICYFIFTHVSVAVHRVSRGVIRMRRMIDGLVVVLLALSLGIAIHGGGQFEIGGVRVSATTIYTPMLAVILLLTLRLAMTVRLHWVGPVASGRRLPSRLLLVVGVCIALLSPILYAMRAQGNDTSLIRPQVFWRSSAPGVDALSFLLPNPNHALLGSWPARWLTNRPGGYAENVASLPLVALVAIGIAYAFYRFRRARVWAALTAVFAWLALGPFIFVGGVNTQVPTAWAFLRYVPILGAARTPARFSIVAMLAFAVLFGAALRRIVAAHRSYRRWILLCVGALLVLELAPVPRKLYDARVPTIYDTIAKDPRAVRVLEIPFGIRDGLSSYGNFTAASQFYQTRHEKPLIGGYLSRMPQSTIRAHQRLPMLAALMRLSEGGALTPVELARARRGGPTFVERARLGWVVVDLARSAPELRAFVEDVFQLVPLEEDAGKRLYRTACCRQGTLPLAEP